MTRAAVFVAQQVLEQHLERERQAGNVAKGGGGGGETEILVAVAADGQRAARLQSVLAELGHDIPPLPECKPECPRAHFTGPVHPAGGSPRTVLPATPGFIR